MAKKNPEEEKPLEFPKVLTFKFPKIKEEEFYAVRTKDGRILARGADELKEMEEGVEPTPGGGE